MFLPIMVRKAFKILLRTIHFDLSSSGQVHDDCHVPTSLTPFCEKLEPQGPFQSQGLRSLMSHPGKAIHPAHFLQHRRYVGRGSAKGRMPLSCTTQSVSGSIELFTQLVLVILRHLAEVVNQFLKRGHSFVSGVVERAPVCLSLKQQN